MEAYLPADAKAQLKELNKAYQDFLKDEPKWYQITKKDDRLFCKSDQAKEAKEAAIAIKDSINNQNFNPVFNDATTSEEKKRLTKVFLKLYATKYQGNNSASMEGQKEYGSIIQAMQLALDNHNFKGCKSANERFSLVESLNLLLLAYQNGTLKGEAKDQIDTAFDNYLTGTEPESKKAETLAKKLHQINNQYNAYNANILPSLMDTGTPKLEVSDEKNSLYISEFNTNYFAPGIYSHIDQKHANDVQAHGGILARLFGGKFSSGILTCVKDQIKSYQAKYKAFTQGTNQDNNSEKAKKLCLKVLEDYVNSWGLKHHYKDQAKATKDKIDKINDVNTENYLTNLKGIISDLQHKVISSSSYHGKSDLNTRLIFLQTELEKLMPEPDNEVANS